jgi:hypothetical protein
LVQAVETTRNLRGPIGCGFNAKAAGAAGRHVAAEILLEAGKEFGALLSELRQREFTPANSFSEPLGEARGGVLAIGRNKFMDRGEKRNLRKAIAVDTFKPRLFPGLGQIGEGGFAFVFRARGDRIGEGYGKWNCAHSMASAFFNSASGVFGQGASVSPRKRRQME